MAVATPDRPIVVERDQVLELLGDLVAEVRGLRADLAASRRRPSRIALLPVIAAAVADRAFSAVELVQHAEMVDDGLRTALDAAHLTTARQVGKTLRALEGRTIRGLRLARIGTDRDGVVWRMFQD